MLAGIWNFEEDGTFKMVAYTVEDECYEPNKYVRFMVEQNGVQVIPHPEDPNKCTLIYGLQASLMGWLPGFIQNICIKM